ncbi:MAG: hypothetical protein AB7H92_18265 [Microbacteriaceae bacterium]
MRPPHTLRSLARHSCAATPWGLTAATAMLAVALVSVVARRPEAMWPLHGAAIGLLAGISAWSVDERCSAIIDLTPRPLWWRTVARAPATLLLVAAWTATHLAVRSRLPDHLGLLLLQGAGAATAGFAAATWQRVRGNAEPGQRIALFVCPTIMGIALAKPWSTHVPLFPVWPHEDWPRATVIWSCIGASAAVGITAALQRDAAARHR